MSLEKPAYRDNLEQLNLYFPNKNLLGYKDLILFTGLSRNAIIRRFKLKDGYISKATLARELC